MGMYVGPNFLDDSVETSVVVGIVVDYSQTAIWFYEGVGALDDVAVSRLPLGFIVMSVGIIDCVVEGVAGIVLVNKKYNIKNAVTLLLK